MQDERDTTRFRDLTLTEFVDRLASPEPVPGGGSAAAVAASLGAALVAMVAQLSLNREKYAQHTDNLTDAAATGQRLARKLLELAEDDALAYGRFSAARRLPKDTDEQRTAREAAIGAAARRAAEVPLETLKVCLDVAAAAERLAGRSNVNASSDLGVAALLADAAAHAAGTNVLVNLPTVTDIGWADKVAGTVVELQNAVEDVARRTREVVGSGEAREPIPAWAGEAVELDA
jgi:glutamate formiminotransferase/formiminotetrahydrofolate cyclodeaminase